MFIYSFRASTLRFFAVLLLAATALVALIVFVPAYDVAAEAGVQINYDNVKTNEDRVKFLGQFGYNVSGEPVESVEVTLPSEFDRVFSGYNELQKAQGLDLSKYKNKAVMRYTYEITNYPTDSGAKVWANVIVWRGRVIGGDVCSADPSGFIHGFERASE
jgi:hypothetical protein